MENIVKISVICSSYNHKKYIKNALDSILAQKTNFPYEIIVHDDASTDGTQEIIQEYQNNNPHIIKSILQKENIYSKGLTTRDFIKPMVDGEYIAFCEGDDYWADPYKLQKQYDIISKNPEYTMVTHKVQKVLEDGTLLNSFVKPQCFNEGEINGKELFHMMLEGKEPYPFHTSSFLIKKDIYLYNTFQFNGDVSYIMGSCLQGNIYYIDEICSCYRIGVPNSYNARIRNKEYAIKKCKKNITAYLDLNEKTQSKYWTTMQHGVCYLSAQLYYATKEKVTLPNNIDFLKEISFKERITASLKYTTIGNFARNMRRIIARRYSNKV